MWKIMYAMDEIVKFAIDGFWMTIVTLTGISSGDSGQDLGGFIGTEPNFHWAPLSSGWRCSSDIGTSFIADL